jgi:hypothetical protein
MTFKVQLGKCAMYSFRYLAQSTGLQWVHAAIRLCCNELYNLADDLHDEITRPPTDPHDNSRNNSQKDGDLCSRGALINRKFIVMTYKLLSKL